MFGWDLTLLANVADSGALTAALALGAALAFAVACAYADVLLPALLRTLRAAGSMAQHRSRKAASPGSSPGRPSNPQ